MKLKVLRLLVLSAVVGLAMVPGAASQAVCPKESCLDAMARCIADGNNHDYFGYVEPLGPCTIQGTGDPATKSYIRCCRLPGCSEDIWIAFCWE